MAIDTAEKRKAISGIMLPLIPGVTPNVSKDAEWRSESGWSYRGFLAVLVPIGVIRLVNEALTTSIFKTEELSISDLDAEELSIPGLDDESLIV